MTAAQPAAASKDRLSRTDWVDQGLRTLARQGESALKVGPLATALEVSRGSFYWHFKDISDYRAQLLQAWQERATDQVIENLDATLTGPARLTHLMKLAFNEDRSLDRAIRAWAAIDPAAAAIVASVDTLRIGYMSQLLAEAGVAPRRARSRAEFLYWAYTGQSAMMAKHQTSIAEDDIDDLSALFTR